jgi:hypothetical protein
LAWRGVGVTSAGRSSVRYLAYAGVRLICLLPECNTATL